MSKIFAYIKLHYKLLLAKDKAEDKKSSVLTFILGALVVFVVAFLLKYLFDIISLQFFDKISPKEFLTVVYLLFGVVLMVVSISKELKMFLFQNDFHIEARFPLSNVQMFVSQLIIVFIDIFTLSILVAFPVVVMFGISASVCSVAFVFGTLFSAVLLPLVPFSVSLLLTIPIMFVLTLLENRNVLKLIIFILVLVALFVLYSIVLNFLADYYISKRVDSVAKQNFINFVLACNNGWNFFTYLANITFGEKIFTSLGILFSASVVLLTLETLVALPVYKTAKENILEGKKKIFEKHSDITKDKAFSAIFKKEFKEIIRTNTYAYFYLGIAILTPVMVFLTNEIIRKIGTAQIGGNISFGVSVIVVFAFISMINSFAGSTISREGREFYVTKISPVEYRRQLFAKGLLNIVISVIAVVMAVIILSAMKFVTISAGLFLLLISVLFSLGSVLNGLNISVRFPNLANKTGGSESQTNSLMTMFIGLIVCAVEGCIAIVLSFLVDSSIIFLILFAITFVYALVNVLVFVFTVNKKYSKIE